MGRIHSIETLGLVDGPGIRFVAFFQGCSLRCAYCHNPDTWDINKGMEITAEELLKKAIRYKAYFQRSSGGVTCSGGEPLLQPEFLTEFLRLCKENGIHTAIDTAGFGKGSYHSIFKYTDLVILDIKHINSAGYRELTGRDMGEFESFAGCLKKSGTKLWLRHIVVPGITDSEEHIRSMKKIMMRFDNVEKIELLPYHTLGVNKYEAMGIPYKLKGVPPMCKDRTKELENIMGRGDRHLVPYCPVC